MNFMNEIIVEKNLNAATRTSGLEEFADAPAETYTGATYWNGEELDEPAERVRVIIGECPIEWWCSDHIGEERDAVKFKYRGETSYIDDKNGFGWAKVTTGKGSPRFESRGLPVEREV